MQGVHDFLWDARQVQEKRGHATSEPEDFLRLGSGMPGWAMLVGLIDEGQEIHVGEEAGLTQWNDALGSVDVPWVVPAPAKVAHVFTNAGPVRTSDHLDLTVSLRSHLAEDLQTWVTDLLSGDLDAARALLPRVREQGFEVYVTRDLDAATSYVRARYEGMQDKRYGLLASSKASNLKSVGLDTWTQGVKHHKAGPWFNNPPSDPASCCRLLDIATEFVCQGLELDFPILCWGTDFTWGGEGWNVRPSRTMAGRRAPEDPAALRLNSYRVLLSRGRDGMALFVPEQPALDETYRMLRSVGVPTL
ncbi:DNA/RNA helicase domain-containing protein [Deinococcus pimensis]|uniref:DNA/RNA helicase domain-containing protein n=1 Tax=Deinococcus pimensis TaxID=309888 RepID=UPI00146F954E|nr:DNA/RNA helicase domain-containing protein [Deinococcus pimensis]